MREPRVPSVEPQASRSGSSVSSLYACLYCPPGAGSVAPPLAAIAEEFSPRYEQPSGDRIVIDIRGLDRLLGSPRTIGEELRREASDRGLRVHVGVARTHTAALVIAAARPGLTVVEPGREAATLAAIPLDVLRVIDADHPAPEVAHWGVRTLGAFAALPSAALAARLGRRGAVWQAIARGEDMRPLVPSRPEERFDASLDLEWPIEGLEPLSFVLTRLLEPLSARLEQRDRGVAVLHITCRLATRPVASHVRRLDLPAPMRDVRTLRTLALLDLEAHPPSAAIDQVSVTIDPTPARVLQHTLFTRPQPTPEQLSTLIARLGAVMGQDRLGAPALVDSFRPGAFAMKPFAIEHRAAGFQPLASTRAGIGHPVSALRRCRQPVPARVAEGRAAMGAPARVTTDRRGFSGGAVLASAGPWRTSGEWWEARAGTAGKAGGWDRDEWDVALDDGGVYRIFRDRVSDRWFIDGVYD